MACVFLSLVFKNMPTNEKPPTIFIINCLQENPRSTLPAKRKEKNIKVAPWYERPTDDIPSEDCFLG